MERREFFALPLAILAALSGKGKPISTAPLELDGGTRIVAMTTFGKGLVIATDKAVYSLKEKSGEFSWIARLKDHTP